MRYTRHGRRRADERGITEDMILEAVSKPTSSFYDLSSGASVVLKKVDSRHLLVVYSEEDGEIKVITTFITSTAQELIDRKLESNLWVKME